MFVCVFKIFYYYWEYLLDTEINEMLKLCGYVRVLSCMQLPVLAKCVYN